MTNFLKTSKKILPQKQLWRTWFVLWKWCVMYVVANNYLQQYPPKILTSKQVKLIAVIWKKQNSMWVKWGRLKTWTVQYILGLYHCEDTSKSKQCLSLWHFGNGRSRAMFDPTMYNTARLWKNWNDLRRAWCECSCSLISSDCRPCNTRAEIIFQLEGDSPKFKSQFKTAGKGAILCTHKPRSCCDFLDVSISSCPWARPSACKNVNIRLERDTFSVTIWRSHPESRQRAQPLWSLAPLASAWPASPRVQPVDVVDDEWSFPSNWTPSAVLHLPSAPHWPSSTCWRCPLNRFFPEWASHSVYKFKSSVCIFYIVLLSQWCGG